MAEFNANSPFERLTIAKYRFRLEATSRIVFSETSLYKGATLHGGFGHALKNISPFYYQALNDPSSSELYQFFKGKNTSGSYPNPYVLLPPLDDLRQYEPGHRFTFELTLFGAAIQCFSVCHAAVEHLGLKLGFGGNRGRYKICGIDVAKPAHDDRQAGDAVSIDPTLSGRAITDGAHYPESLQVTIHTVTRLRLKDDDRLLRRPPPFRVFFARLLGRANSLAVCYGTGRLVTPQEKEALLLKAMGVKKLSGRSAWKEWERYSGSQKCRMKFGGICDAITYVGRLGPFIPYLSLGEWIHLGGKTSFGMGKYVLDRGQ